MVLLSLAAVYPTDLAFLDLLSSFKQPRNFSMPPQPFTLPSGNSSANSDQNRLHLHTNQPHQPPRKFSRSSRRKGAKADWRWVESTTTTTTITITMVRYVFIYLSSGYPANVHLKSEYGTQPRPGSRSEDDLGVPELPPGSSKRWPRHRRNGDCAPGRH